MNEIQVNAYLYNIQLTKLVSSADVLLQHVYNLLSSHSDKELRTCIFMWLCEKREFDDCLANKSIDSFDSDLSSSETFDSEDSHGTSNESDAKSKEENVLVNVVHSKSVRETLSTVNKNDAEIKEETNLNTIHSNQCSISESSLNNSSFKFCRYCSNETNECYPLSSMSISEQIEQLRKIREPILHNCRSITRYTRQRDYENNPQLKELIMWQDILEFIDMSIEIKNDSQVMNQKIQDFINSNFPAYSAICNCIKILSTSEVRYFFIIFMQKIIDIRESSYPLDKLILQLDNDIVDREVRLHHLNKNYERLKAACLSLSKKTGYQLPPSHVLPFENLNCSLAKSRITESKDETNQLLSCHPSNIKTNRSPTTLLNVPSKSLCVSREGKKLVIHHNKKS